jgi:hypothetical protein
MRHPAADSMSDLACDTRHERAFRYRTVMNNYATRLGLAASTDRVRATVAGANSPDRYRLAISGDGD